MANELITFTESQMDLIKRTYCPGLTDDEVAIFLDNCRSCGLDPRQKHIYAIKRSGKLCIQTSIDGLRLIAERTGKYAPGSDTEFIYSKEGKLLGAKVFVKKHTQGDWHSVSATAYLAEYTTNSGLWAKMPHVMLEKCAEARALRRCFPEVMSGLYSEDEMLQADANPIDRVTDKDRISDETWENLDQYLNGHQDLRAELQKLCNVVSLRDIKSWQLPSVRAYAKTHMEKLNNVNSKD